MEDNAHIKVNNLLYSCVNERSRGNEQFIQEHSLGYFMAGEMQIVNNDGGKFSIPGGSIGIARRNQLIKSIKVPPPGGEFKSINITISQAFLRLYAVEHKIGPVEKYTSENMRALPPDPFLLGYFESLLPYFNHDMQPGESMADLKTREAVELLLRIDPGMKSFLFDFSEPHKIDLEAFMNQNYTYNVSTEQFAKLTGRSLASFKRDFARIFQTSPGQWLQQKRLSEAYYLIKEKGRKASDIYLDIGFENLSHFSYSFKKTYGVAPSML